MWKRPRNHVKKWYKNSRGEIRSSPASEVTYLTIEKEGKIEFPANSIKKGEKGDWSNLEKAENRKMSTGRKKNSHGCVEKKRKKKKFYYKEMLERKRRNNGITGELGVSLEREKWLTGKNRSRGTADTLHKGKGGPGCATFVKVPPMRRQKKMIHPPSANWGKKKLAKETAKGPVQEGFAFSCKGESFFSPVVKRKRPLSENDGEAWP